jgi:hypothetical protein
VNGQSRFRSRGEKSSRELWLRLTSDLPANARSGVQALDVISSSKAWREGGPSVFNQLRACLRERLPRNVTGQSPRRADGPCRIRSLASARNVLRRHELNPDVLA